MGENESYHMNSTTNWRYPSVPSPARNLSLSLGQNFTSGLG